ncbi:MAG: flavin reductase family protein [Muribaculaceae bacterium]|nr:flavin reductase family protein [Muribaculaceae bacterium]
MTDCNNGSSQAPGAKRQLPPGTMIYPLPAVIVTCGDSVERSNMLTVAWTGTICTNPAMCYISVRPTRHSYPLIRDNMQFTINLTTERMARATDWAGVRSGADHDKWKETGLTPMPGMAVSCPYIQESPLSIECRVKTIMPLGSHDMFIAEVVNVIAEESLFDPATDTFRLEDAGLMNYTHGHYYGQGAQLGRFGFSVMKKRRQ